LLAANWIIHRQNSNGMLSIEYGYTNGKQK
jgi:hypothetical protein